MISNLSQVSKDAKIADDVEIGPYCYIEEDVVIDQGCVIMPHVTILNGARIGKNNKFFPGAVIAGIPQDLKFKGEYTTLEVGDNNTFRECVTLNRGTASKNKTIIGSNNLIMAYSHVGHDCVLGNNLVISNSAQIAGEVRIDDWAVIGGSCAILQFAKVGTHSMSSGKVAIIKDLPPYTKAGRNPIQFCGINSVGLHRRGFTKEQIDLITECYRIVYLKGYNNSQAIKIIEQQIPQCVERDEVINFIKTSKIGIMKGPKN